MSSTALLLLLLLIAALSCRCPAQPVSSSSSASSIVFGMSAPFTGSNAFLGLNTYNGIQAAFSRSNRLALLPVNLTLVALDDGYNPDIALTNMQLLSTQYNLLGVLGSVGTPTVLNILPYLTQFSIPLYGPVTGVRSLRHPFLPSVVNVRASYDDECEAIVRLCVNLGRLRVSIFYQNDGFGQAGLNGLQLALSRRGLAIISNATYVRNTLQVQSGLDAMLTGIVPQAVLCVGVGPACGAFINAAVNSSSAWSQEDIAYFALSFVAAESLAAALLPTTTPPVYVSQVVPPPYPSNKSTAAASLANEFNTELNISCPLCSPTFAALEGYMAGKLVSSELLFNPSMLMEWLALPSSLVSVNSSTIPARLAFANNMLEQGMLPAGGTVRQGPYGTECTGDEFDSLGFCSCNQGSHVVFLTQLNYSSYTFVDLPDDVYTFVDCGTVILEPVLLANQPIIFGQSAALTGPESFTGSELNRGIRAAFNEYNTDNLATRRNLLLIAYDDQANISLTVTNVRDLIQQQQIFALVGSGSDLAILAQLPLTIPAGVPMVGPLSGLRQLRFDNDDAVINLRASFDDQCAAVVTAMVDSVGCTSIGALVGVGEVDDAMLTSLTLALTYHRTQPAVSIRYDTTALAGVTQLLNSNISIDCLYLNAAATDAAAAIIELRLHYGSSVSYFLNDNVGPELLQSALNGQTGQVYISQAMPSPYINASNSSLPNAAFVSAYQSAIAALFADDPHVSYPSIEGYMVGRLIAAALTSDPEQTSQSWLNNLYSLGAIDLDGLTVGPYQRTSTAAAAANTTATGSVSSDLAAATSNCDQGYATVTMTSFTASQWEQDTAYSVPSMNSIAAFATGQQPLVQGVGASGVCGVFYAYQDPPCQANSQKVSIALNTTAFACLQCLDGQVADGSTSQCEYPTDSIPTSSLAIVDAVAAVLIVLTVAVVVAVGVWHKRPSIRAASPLFLVLILVGVLLGLATVLLMSQPTLSQALCGSATVLGHLAYALSIGALVAKSYRLAAIFNQRQLKVLKISDRLLTSVLGAALLLLLTYLTVWMAVDAPVPTLVVNLSAQTQTVLCQSASQVWSVALVSIEAALLLYGAVITYRCRHNPEAFNETRYIAVIFYNCTVVGGVVVAVLYSIPLSFLTTAMLECCAMLVIAFTLLAALFGPKLYQIRAPPAEQLNSRAQAAKQSNSSHHTVQVKPQAGKPTVHTGSPFMSTSSLKREILVSPSKTFGPGFAAHGWTSQATAAAVAADRDLVGDTVPSAEPEAEQQAALKKDGSPRPVSTSLGSRHLQRQMLSPTSSVLRPHAVISAGTAEMEENEAPLVAD